MKQIILISSLFLSACSQPKNSAQNRIDQSDSLQELHKKMSDTLLIYKISYDSSNRYIFQTKVQAADLNQEEINLCEILLRRYISDYNKKAKLKFEEITKEHPNEKPDILDYVINLHDYGRQYMAVISDRGEKIIYVNCVYDIGEFDTAEKHLISVDDGGNHYFDFKVDLNTKQIFDFVVNGEG